MALPKSCRVGSCCATLAHCASASHTAIAPDDGNCVTVALAGSLEAPCIARLACSHASGLKRGRPVVGRDLQHAFTQAVGPQ